MNETTSELIGNEDCLYLNLYMPRDIPLKNIPVLFWIHGGSFTVGSGESDHNGMVDIVKMVIICNNSNLRVNKITVNLLYLVCCCGYN